MNILTLGTAKTTVARALNMCSTDPRVVDLINEAQQRLLNRPTRAVGADMQYTFCFDPDAGGCLTLPRQIKTVERWAMCGQPGVVRSAWFDMGFNGAGLWSQSQDCCSDCSDYGLNLWPGRTPALKDMGTACCFNDPTKDSEDYIQVTTDVTEAAGTYLWLFGYDENRQWIRSLIDGTWQDGERVDLGSAPLVTTNKYTSLVRTKKVLTNGIVRLYQYAASGTGVVQALAFYEPSETDPIYRRVLIPGYPVPTTTTVVTASQMWWGVNAATTLDAAGIAALANTRTSDDPAYTYGFSPTNEYLYFAWAASLTDQPIAGLGFTSGGFPVSLAGVADGYTSSENGYNFKLVSVGGVNYRLYRSTNKLSLALDVVVTT